MAIGTEYTDKDQLLEKGIQDLVYKNGKNLIPADDVQKAMKNIVESLWDRGGSGGCDVETFTQTVENATLNITRQVCGDTVLISGQVTQASYSGNPGEVRIEVMPLDFMDKTWFKATRVVMLNTNQAAWQTSPTPNGLGSLGYLYVNQFSSTVDDPSYLVMDGNIAGSGRSYVVDNPGSGITDSDDNLNTNYLNTSPLDLRQHSLTIGFDNAETKGTAVVSLNDIDWKFTIEGNLM